MSDLNFTEKHQLEKLFQMSSGYVLDFSNRTFQEFIVDAVRRDIDDIYKYGAGSKANRLREFWKSEPNVVVGQLVRALIDHAVTIKSTDKSFVDDARRIATRLCNSTPVADIDAIQATTDDRSFEALAESVRDSIRKNEPEAGLDRLHTYVTKLLRSMCDEHGIEITKDKPLHSAFGEYVRQLHKEGVLESEMTVKILKSTTSVLEAFNHVRNNQSFAHDNELLNYDESMFIFNNVCYTVRFLMALEQQVQEEANQAAVEAEPDELPF